MDTVTWTSDIPLDSLPDSQPKATWESSFFPELGYVKGQRCVIPFDRIITLNYMKQECGPDRVMGVLRVAVFEAARQRGPKGGF